MSKLVNFNIIMTIETDIYFASLQDPKRQNILNTVKKLRSLSMFKKKVCSTSIYSNTRLP